MARDRRSPECHPPKPCVVTLESIAHRPAAWACRTSVLCPPYEEAVRFAYVGPASLVGDLAQTLENAGIAVDYRPPFETKDMATALAASVVLTATGSVPDVVRLARAWAASRPDTRVEGLPEPQGRGSLQDRLEEIDRLLAAGAVTQHERDTQRSKTLGEL